MSGSTAPTNSHAPRGRMPHAVVMMLLIIIAAVGLTYIVPSGEFERKKDLVVPGSYQTLPKDYGRTLEPKATHDKGVAYPASPVVIVSSIPAGMVRQAALIFMILFIGGMFGVLQQTGALE